MPTERIETKKDFETRIAKLELEIHTVKRVLCGLKLLSSTAIVNFNKIDKECHDNDTAIS